MKHLRVDHCACGLPIFLPLPELIIDYNISEYQGGRKTKKKKGKAKQETVKGLCFFCRIEHDKKIYRFHAEKFKAIAKLKHNKNG